MNKGRETYFYYWPDAFIAGAEKAGGKGWNLSRLDRYGFRVPTGGVLAVGAYYLFLEENNLLQVRNQLAGAVDITGFNEKGNEAALLQMQNKIRAGSIPEPVREELLSGLINLGIIDKPLAVRSSAAAEDSARASFAGIHESFLNIRGFEDLLEAIKACYASLWTPRAAAYRRKMKTGDDEVMQAVVIMELVEATAAGTGFSCDPRTGREDVILINANYGYGESVVSGAVDPDEYQLCSTLGIKHKRIGRKEGVSRIGQKGGLQLEKASGLSKRQVLGDGDIARLGLLIRRVYDALGSAHQHQDVEWVFDGRNFALVQARPVTALPRYTFDEIRNQPDIWSNANLKDALPMVQSTLNWSLIRKTANDLELFGFLCPPGLQNIKLFQGRAYFNLSMQQWMLFDAFGITPRQLNQSLGGHQPEIEINAARPYRGRKGFQRLGRVLKLLAFIRKTRRGAGEWFNRVNQFTGAITKEELLGLSDHSMIEKMDMIKKMLSEFNPVFFGCNMAADVNPLIKILEKYFPGEGKNLANRLMVGKGETTSAGHGYCLAELAETARGDEAARSFFRAEEFHPLHWQFELPEESPFKRLFREFLVEYGHRGVYEMDIINPRWAEDPTYPLEIIKNTLETASVQNIKNRQEQQSRAAWREIEAKMPFLSRRMVQQRVQQAVIGMQLREMAKAELVKLYGAMRFVAQEIGGRLAERGILAELHDVFHCTWYEIVAILNGSWDGKGLQHLVQERQAIRKEMEVLFPPDYIIDDKVHYVEPVNPGAGTKLEGMGVSAGKAYGPARRILHPHQGHELQAGDVLVAHSTDPGWTPLFLRAAAIVVETGGAGSHGSIVAREYGIPAVVNIPGVMQIVKDGQNLVVDGDEGLVYLP